MQNCAECPPFDCAALVARCQSESGDRAAAEELCQKFRPLVWTIVTRVLGRERADEWDDATQAIFVRVLERLKTWRGDCPFCKWLGVVATRRAVDFRRQRHLPPLPEADTIPGPAGNPPRLSPEEIECIRRKVAGFPADWRRVWELYLEGVKREQIASEVGRSLRTILYWLAEMKEQLQQCVED
jgi:RNA polymerase sigma factor (sigma-70 family)